MTETTAPGYRDVRHWQVAHGQYLDPDGVTAADRFVQRVDAAVQMRNIERVFEDNA